MKKDLKIARDLAPQAQRERVLDEMLTAFRLSRTISKKNISDITDCLSPDEYQNAFDTLTLLRMKAFDEDYKPLQAYNSLLDGLKEEPTNISLQLERTEHLDSCHRFLDRLLATDLKDPMIEVAYELLLKEGHLGPFTQAHYLEYLIESRQYAEAIDLALPLCYLHPSFVGLRERVEELLTHVHNDELKSFLDQPGLQICSRSLKSTLEPAKARRLIKQFQSLLGLVLENDTGPEIPKILKEVLGEVDEHTILDLAYKDFFYCKAVYDGNNGRHWESITLLKKLCEVDPCNMQFRNSLSVEVDRFCEAMAEKAKKGEPKVDLGKIYLILKNIGQIPYKFLEQVCLAEVASGLTSSAKEKINHLCRLSPYDGDYLLCALNVAMDAHDSQWITEILEKLNTLKQMRPWDLTVAAFETME